MYNKRILYYNYPNLHGVQVAYKLRQRLKYTKKPPSFLVMSHVPGLESNQTMNAEPISQSFSRYVLEINYPPYLQVYLFISFLIRKFILDIASYRNLTPSSTTPVESLIVENENNNEVEVPKLTGRRMFDVEYLFQQSAIDHSPFNCSLKDFNFVSEYRSGFYSSFNFICNMCGVNFLLQAMDLLN